jgi:hypothetical protein
MDMTIGLHLLDSSRDRGRRKFGRRSRVDRGAIV